MCDGDAVIHGLRKSMKENTLVAVNFSLFDKNVLPVTAVISMEEIGVITFGAYFIPLNFKLGGWNKNVD